MPGGRKPGKRALPDMATERLRHVVMFRLRDDVTDADVELIKSELLELPKRIDVVRYFELGEDLGLVEGNADLVWLAEFDSEEDYLRYTAHPAHTDFFTSVLSPRCAERTAMQYRPALGGKGAAVR
jgi:hypothetical protein